MTTRGPRAVRPTAADRQAAVGVVAALRSGDPLAVRAAVTTTSPVRLTAMAVVLAEQLLAAVERDPMDVGEFLGAWGLAAACLEDETPGAVVTAAATAGMTQAVGRLADDADLARAMRDALAAVGAARAGRHAEAWAILTASGQPVTAQVAVSLLAVVLDEMPAEDAEQYTVTWLAGARGLEGAA